LIEQSVVPCSFAHAADNPGSARLTSHNPRGNLYVARRPYQPVAEDIAASRKSVMALSFGSQPSK
jgi:hypothetical protein